jgi:elongation factor Ts
MTTITAAQVKELRDLTSVGMMECKAALELAGGDIELAVQELRKSGKARAGKKAGRIAAEGLVLVRTSEDGARAIVLEINSETDFVARDENFRSFAEAVARTALDANETDPAKISAMQLHGSDITVEEARLVFYCQHRNVFA